MLGEESPPACSYKETMNNNELFNTGEQLIHENDELALLLVKTQEVLKAIRHKEHVALPDFRSVGENIFSLPSCEMSFRVFVEEMSEGASALSSDGTVLFCNKRFAELLHTSAEQITGKRFDHFLYPDDKPEFLKLLHAGLIRKSQAELRCLPLDGESPELLHLCANSFLAGNLEEKICLIANDFSGPHRFEQELRRTQKSCDQRITYPTDELTRANEELLNSRIAYLNMMQDTVETGDTLKVSNKKLVRQSKKRRKAEQLLKKSVKTISTLLNASPEAIMKINIDNTINDVSNIAPELFGFEKKNEIRGKLFWDFVLPGELKKIQKLFKEIISNGPIQDIETTLVKNDKSTFIAEISLTLVGKRGGEPKAYMAIIRDITLRKKMDMQLIHNSRLVSLGEMATGIAHEINQPLNTISLTLDNFLYEVDKIESIDKSYFQKKSEKIFDNIYRIRDIIEHIRDFSRYQDDHLLDIFDLHKSITNAISMVSEEFKYKEIDLQLDFENTDSHVLGNVYKFEQVILNLLANAKDAFDGKEKIAGDDTRSYIKIRTFLEDAFIFVTVEDNGSGIKASEIDNVLLPFYSTKEEGKGTGLGLSISYGIIREMKGTLTIQSKLGVGTTMLIMLPVEKREPEKITKEE